MVDSRRFTRGAQLDPKALKEVTVRRLKTDIKSRNFKQRTIDYISFESDNTEEVKYDQLVGLLKESARGRGGNKSLGVAALLLQKRFLSSPWSFACTLSNYLLAPQSEFDWEYDDYYAEVMGSGQTDGEEGKQEQPEFQVLSSVKADKPLSAASNEQIRSFVEWGSGFESRPNGRLKALIGWLDTTCRPGGAWNAERVVVFTEYADTLDWLTRVLRTKGYDEKRLAVIQGSTSAEDRETIRARFCADPAEEPLRVLVATDAAGEGIDLQTWCHKLVNFDVPFNPSRLEQRVGRIDRYGQRFAPEIYYFKPTNANGMLAGELDFMGRIARKVAVAEDDLGSMNPLVDDEIVAHFAGARPSRVRTKAERHSDEAINGVLAGGLELNKQLDRLERTYEASREALHVSPEAERRVVDVALALTNQPRLIEGTRPGTYELPQLNRSWEAVKEGFDTVLKRGVLRPLTFGASLAETNSDLVYAHLGSALVAKSARVLRGNLYGEGRLNRVTAVVVPEINQTCAAAIARLVLVGRGGLRVHEEVFVTGIRFRGANMAEEKVQKLLDGALDVGDLELASLAVRRRLAREWNASHGRLHNRLEEEVGRRANVRKAAVEDNLRAREKADLERVRGIYGAFRENLRTSLGQLNGEDQAQLTLDLFEEERRQRQQDVKNIARRLESVDDEETRELNTVRERYRDVKPYLSIAALVFAVSPADVEAWEAEDGKH